MQSTLSLREVLIRRDKMTPDEADDRIAEAREAVAAGENPEEIFHDWFGLEPDYIFDLI